MAEFTIVGLDPEAGLFAHHDAQSWQEVDALVRLIGRGPVMIFNGIVPAADGRQPQDLKTWVAHNDLPVQQPFSLNPKFAHSA